MAKTDPRMLLDTTILVDHLRRVNGAVRFIASLTQKPHASVVSLAELMAGAKSRREENKIRDLKHWIRFHDVDTALAERAGQFMKHFQASHGLDDIDALIAATAEHHGLALATLNVKHFPMFKGLKAAY